MNDFDPAVAVALDSYVARFDRDETGWGDVLDRAGIRSRAAGRPRRRRLLALAAALAAVAGLAATPPVHALVDDTLGSLESWLGSTPGSPASTEEQSGFESADESSVAQLPPNTRVGLLTTAAVAGERYDLLGFRDGSSYCLRLVRAAAPARRDAPAACVPARELDRIAVPAVALAAGNDYEREGERTAQPVTAVYGLASSTVDEVTIVDDAGRAHSVRPENEAFLYAAPAPDGHEAAFDHLTARRGSDSVDVPIAGPRPVFTGYDALPGPTAAEHPVHESSIAWLEAHEARGEPFTWPASADAGISQRTTFARLIRPLAGSSFRLGVATATSDAEAAAGDWYCLAWLWPLVQHAYATSCVRAGTFPFMESAIPPSSGQFPLYIGLAPDAVASIEVYFPGGATEQVPIVDNVFAFQAWRAQPAKLVAYDAEGNPVWVTPVA